MKNSKLLLALLAVLLAAGAAFLASKISAKDPARTREPAAEPAPLLPAPSEPQEESTAAPWEPEEQVDRVALQEPVEPDPLPVTGAENFDLDGAQWIRGQVVAPPATPPDLSLEVVAVALARGEVVADPGESLSGDRSVLEFFERDGRAISRRSVSLGLGAGAFELPMPATADRAALFVDGQYLYLKTAEIVELGSRDESSDPIELRAELGSSLRIVVQPPQGVDAASIEGTAVQLVGVLDSDLFQQDAERTMKRREARWIPGEVIVWRGLPEGLRLSLTASHPDHVDASLMVTRLLEARERRVELRLGSGETLVGKVTDEEGLGIADATLLIRVDSRSSGLLNMSSAFLDLTEEPIVLQTGTDGSFELRGLEPGTIEIEAQKPGWSKVTVQDLSLPRDEPLEIQLSRGERIAGRVQWPDGTPAVGARVAVRSELSQSTHYGETNLQGRFLISGLVPGPLIVHAELDRRTRSDDAVNEEVAPTVADRLRVSPDLDSQDTPPGFRHASRLTADVWRATRGPVPHGEEQVLTLEEPCTLRGRVVSTTGEAISTFRVQCDFDGGAGWPLTHPDVVERFGDSAKGNSTGSRSSAAAATAEFSTAGEFVIEGMGRGSWTVTVVSEEYLSEENYLYVNLPRSEPIELELRRGLALRGVVRDPLGALVQGARIFAGPSGTNLLDLRYGRYPRVESGAEGEFRVAALQPGTCDLFVEHEDWASPPPFAVELSEDAEPPVVELVLGIGGSLEGIIYDREGRPDPDRPIQVFSMGAGTTYVLVSDESGRFARSAMSPGTYQVVSEPTAEELEEMIADGEVEPGPAAIAAVVRMASVEIREGELAEVVLGEPPTEPVRVFGSVRFGDRLMDSGFVLAIPEGQDLLNSFRPAQVTESGQYEVMIDEPGDFVFLYQGRDELQDGVPFQLTVPGDLTDFEFDLELPTSGITGVVRGVSGDPVEGVPVRLSTSGGGMNILLAFNGSPTETTDSEGRYRFEGVPPREGYVVRAGGRGPFSLRLRSDLTVREDTLLEDIDFVLGRPGAVIGTVLDASGNPVRGASVFARDERGRALEPYSRTTSGPSGKFELDGLTSGEAYFFFARTSDSVSAEPVPAVVRPGEKAEVTLVLAPGTQLRVALRDKAGDPIRARLSVRDESGAEHAGLLGADARDRLMVEGVSSSDLIVGPLPPGKYALVATTADGREKKKRVTLKGQEERRVKLRF